MGHTPGPWIATSERECFDCNDYGDDRGYYAISQNPEIQIHEPIPGDRVADAHLIAAAPDLLAVCKELEASASYWSEYDVPLGIVDRLKAAIAKATGATP